MAEFARAVQPYAHYSTSLSQWQTRLHGFHETSQDGEKFDGYGVIEIAPRAYDPKRATRITLFHAILTFLLARVWLAGQRSPDQQFAALVNRLRIALGNSAYLDGHKTGWS